MPFMWSDTLEAAERAHLLRLLLWGGASLLIGTALLALLRVHRERSALLDQFGLQNAAWGAIELALALLRLRSLGVRDLAAATRLDRLLWLSIGLEAGVIAVGLTLMMLGWRVIRRPALVGAGLGVIVQGAALSVIDLALAARISR
jgi:hypothetical protein